MARKKTPDEPLPPAKLVVPRYELARQIEERLVNGRELVERAIVSPADLDQAWNDRKRWSAYNTELLLRSFDNRSIADDYNWSPGFASVPLNPSLEQQIGDFRETQADRLNRLQSIHERLPLIHESAAVARAAPTTPRALPQGGQRSVFIVHGRDQGARETVARFVERIGLSSIILHERPNQGRTLIEKFEANAEVAFALILLTADDQCQSAGVTESRARQNVIFELGYFFGALGRHRVAALYSPGVELPSDISGLVYIELDAHEAWKFQLVKELKAAGLPVDSDRLFE